jgi:hypothetical protein
MTSLHAERPPTKIAVFSANCGVMRDLQRVNNGRRRAL